MKFHSVYICFFFLSLPFSDASRGASGLIDPSLCSSFVSSKPRGFVMTRRQHPAGAGKTSNAGQRCNMEILRAADPKCLHQFRRVNAKSFAYRFCCGRLLSRADSAPSIIKGGIISARGKEGRVGPGWGGGPGGAETLQESSQLISQLIKSARSARLEIDQNGSKRRDCNLNEQHFMTR